VLDPTKIIPEELVPVRPVGRLVLNRVVDNFFAETEQVAFCTQNIVPGIDFTNDPLLQGRNFSYLDTQLKRLGSPNFTHLPVNAPKCPFSTFQQDGHMTVSNPTSRANYEPNSWPESIGGPREDPEHGFTSYPETETGEKRRVRAELFADHYSQARQFYVSQTPVEQRHIADAFVFELSKVERPDIRIRMVANLMNVDDDLAAKISAGIGIREEVEASTPARAPLNDLEPSPALSILLNGPGSIAGRKIGVLVTDGVDKELLTQLQGLAAANGALVELVGPRVAGVETQDGRLITTTQMIEGGPSVLYDAVVIMGAAPGIDAMAENAAAKDFVTDAFAHCKFVGYTAGSRPLLDAAGVPYESDDGFIAVDTPDGIGSFLTQAADLRIWNRESLVHQS
jgi:catalase